MWNDVNYDIIDIYVCSRLEIILSAGGQLCVFMEISLRMNETGFYKVTFLLR